MSMGNPPTPEELPGQALLGEETLTISALEDLPKMIFLSLLKEAFSRRLPNIVRAMMAAWPLPYFTVRAWITSIELELYLAVVGGLRALLTQQDCPG